MAYLNSCNTEVFNVDKFNLLKRFLLLGVERGTYYINKDNLFDLHIDSIEEILKEGDYEGLETIIKDTMKRVYKQDYLLYIIARCCIEKSKPELRKTFYEIMLDVCKTPTQLFMFIGMYEMLHKKHHNSTGWNKYHKAYISKWYQSKDVQNLVYLTTKYRNRNGWTHRDVLRLAHPKATNDSHHLLYNYITRGFDSFKEELQNRTLEPKLQEYITDFEAVSSNNINIDSAVELIKKHKFVREHVATHLLNEPIIWETFINQGMPMIALLRNINKITSLDLFNRYPKTLTNLIDRLGNKDIIQHSKVHPLQLLTSLKMYSKGAGDKGKLSWIPNKQLCYALNTAFKYSFNNVKPINKRFLLALDVSGSMTWASVCGIDCLMASEVSTAMAMIIKSVEPNCDVMGFANEFRKLDIYPDNTLEQNMKSVYYCTFGSTDCSLPMRWALENKKEYDAIIVFTDNETNSNEERPCDSLTKYNKEMGLNCKLIVVSTSANDFTIADPNNPNMLDICGFDASTHQSINDFIEM